MDHDMNKRLAAFVPRNSSAIAKTILISLLTLFSSTTFASALDCVEDGAEKVGSVIEENWEKLEDGLFGETPEERAEEARERAADRAEELEEERQGKACQYNR